MANGRRKGRDRRQFQKEPQSKALQVLFYINNIFLYRRNYFFHFLKTDILIQTKVWIPAPSGQVVFTHIWTKTVLDIFSQF